MINLKTKKEIDILRQGGIILADILNKTAQKAKAGATTEELENFAYSEIIKAGGRPAFLDLEMPNGFAFPSSLCISVNDEIVHAPALPPRLLKAGDIVGIDVGMEYPYKENGPRGMFTDTAVTVGVGGISDEASKLIAVTKKALDLAIAEAKPGKNLNDIGRTVERFVQANGFSVVRELVGHGVGYDVHEEPRVPNYEILDNSLENVVLEPGMVIAIEPMVNAGTHRIKVSDDELTFKTEDGRLSAHFEHTIAITEKGNIVITAG